jgi:hypothetical protein
VQATFGNGAWQHIGFGSLDFSGDQYLLLSTFNGTTNLYARANTGGGEQRVDLGPIPSGSHHYQIVWGGTEVSFWIDGVYQTSFALSGTPSNLYTYLSNNGGASLQVDAAQRPPAYQASGSYTSCALDAGTGAAWQTLSWDAVTPAGPGLNVGVRTSADGVSWGSWAPVAASGDAIAAGRYLEYRLALTSSSGTVSPQVNAVTLTRE